MAGLRVTTEPEWRYIPALNRVLLSIYTQIHDQHQLAFLQQFRGLVRGQKLSSTQINSVMSMLVFIPMIFQDLQYWEILLSVHLRDPTKKNCSLLVIFLHQQWKSQWVSKKSRPQCWRILTWKKSIRHQPRHGSSFSWEIKRYKHTQLITCVLASNSVAPPAVTRKQTTISNTFNHY